MPPWRSRPRLIGTRRTVVSFISPVVASRTRIVVLVGNNCHTAHRIRIPVMISRERILRISPLAVEAVAGRHRVARELRDESVPRRKLLHVAQSAYPFDGYRVSVPGA